MSRKVIKAALSAFFILFFTSGCSKIEGAGVNAQLHYAPDFKLASTQGREVSLADYKGKNNVLLVFWTTWCPYCRSALKKLNEEYKDLREANIIVLAINISEPPARVVKFKQSLQLDFEILLDANSQAASDYDILGVPTYILIKKDASIVFNGTRLSFQKIKDLTKD